MPLAFDILHGGNSKDAWKLPRPFSHMVALSRHTASYNLLLHSDWLTPEKTQCAPSICCQIRSQRPVLSKLLPVLGWTFCATERRIWSSRTVSPAGTRLPSLPLWIDGLIDVCVCAHLLVCSSSHCTLQRLINYSWSRYGDKCELDYWSWQ